MRSILLAFLLVLIPTSAAADVILPGMPPRSRPRPSYPIRTPLPTPVTEVPFDPPGPVEPSDEDWHPNIEQIPPGDPQEAGAALAVIAVLMLALFVRESRRQPA